MEKKENEGMNQQAPVNHADAKQDIELIKKIIAEYLGDEELENQEAMKACTEAYEACKEMGMESEEAMKMAGSAMKLAKHMAGKKAEKKSEAEPEEEMKDEEKEESKEGTKESTEIARLKGEITRLKEGERKTSLNKYLDDKLSGLKESRRVTDEIRKIVGTPKSEAYVDQVISNFMAGFSEASKSNGGSQGFNFAECLEKTNRTFESDSKINSFSDCLK